MIMPLFCIIGFDAEGAAEKRERLMDPHIEALTKMNRAGRLFAAGPLMTSADENTQYYGSMLIIAFENQQAAEDWFHQEPYYIAGVYAQVTIKPYLDAVSLCV
jgi:uncharacterized protein YciI